MIEEEARFCRLLREGQQAAMEKMVESYGDRLLRGAFFLCRNEPEAQDLVHDTFYQAFRSVKNFNGNSSLYTWLYRILRNLYLNQNRRKKIFSALISGHQASWLRPDAEGQNSGDISGPGLMDVMSDLPLKHREILLLRYVEGLKIQEIGEILGLSYGTVKSRLYHAIRKLKKKLLRTPNFGRCLEKENAHEM
jgi:RNA polymerase sigma-70 factor (ECF subfamily)